MHFQRIPVSPTCRALVAAVAACSVVSCSCFSEQKQPVTVVVSDPEAEIRIDGAFVGKGRATALLDKADTHAVVATKGDKIACASIDSNMSTTGYLDAVGTFFFLFPVVGFFSSGAWQLDTTDIHLLFP